MYQDFKGFNISIIKLLPFPHTYLYVALTVELKYRNKKKKEKNIGIDFVLNFVSF